MNIIGGRTSTTYRYGSLVALGWNVGVVLVGLITGIVVGAGRLPLWFPISCAAAIGLGLWRYWYCIRREVVSSSWLQAARILTALQTVTVAALVVWFRVVVH